MRKANRADHVNYLNSGTAVSQAGPLLSDEGEMIGSLIIGMSMLWKMPEHGQKMIPTSKRGCLKASNSYSGKR